MSYLYKNNGRYWLKFYDENGKQKGVPMKPPGHRYATKSKAVAVRLKKQYEQEQQREAPRLEDTLPFLAVRFGRELLKTTTKEHAGTSRHRACIFLKAAGVTHAEQITTPIVQKFLDGLACAPATIKGYKSAISAFCAFLIRKEFMTDNPCTRGRIITPRLDNRAVDFLREDECEEILIEAQSDPTLYIGILICLEAGLRLSEMRLLRWKYFNFDQNTLVLPPEITKTRHPRAIPLSSRLKKALLDRGKLYPIRGKQWWLEKLEPVRVKYKPYFDRCAKKGIGSGFHAFRHAFCSHHVMRGTDIVKIAKWVGHSSINTTYQRYAHLAPEYDEDINRL